MITKTDVLRFIAYVVFAFAFVNVAVSAEETKDFEQSYKQAELIIENRLKVGAPVVRSIGAKSTSSEFKQELFISLAFLTKVSNTNMSLVDEVQNTIKTLTDRSSVFKSDKVLVLVVDKIAAMMDLVANQNTIEIQPLVSQLRIDEDCEVVEVQSNPDALRVHVIHVDALNAEQNIEAHMSTKLFYKSLSMNLDTNRENLVLWYEVNDADCTEAYLNSWKHSFKFLDSINFTILAR